MRPIRPAHSLLFNTLSLLLSYALSISLCTPFVIYRAEASVRGNATQPAAPTRAASQSSAAPTNGLLVRFRPGLSEQAKNNLLDGKGARQVRRLRGASGLEVIELLNSQNAGIVAADLSLDPRVQFAEPNYLITADEVTPNDSRFPEQWSLNTAGQSGINATDAWGTTTGSAATLIAVLDSGIDFTHPDLSGNRWINSAEQANGRDDDRDGYVDDRNGWDFVAESSQIKDGQGHGTAVAGLIAAQGNNSTGISGVMWQAGLMSLRVLDAGGTGDIAHAIEAMDYAVAHGAQVINCSWGTDGNSQALRAVIERAARRHVIVVSAAGNAGRDIETTPRFPASFDLPNIIAVASTDHSDHIPSWSNWGMGHVTVAAPGVELLTTKMGGDYQVINGTSASAALVSGVVGLIKTLRPQLNAERTKEMIMRGVRPVAALQGKVAAGGVINASGSLGMINSLSPNEGLEGAANDADRANGNNGHINQDAPFGNLPGTMGDGERFKVKPSTPTPGAAASGLPNLDEVRRRRHTPHRAPAPIPSTLCSPRLRGCARGQQAQTVPSPAQTGIAVTQRSEPIALMASNEGFPLIESLLGFNTGAVSDTPFSIKLSSSVSGSHSQFFALMPQSPPTENVVWTNDFGVSVSANNMTKTAGTAAWDSGASSTKAIVGDGYAEFTVGASDSYGIFGLNHNDTNQSYYIDYAITISSGGGLDLKESGQPVGGPFSPWAPGDRFRIAIEGGTVKYYRNSVLLYTSTAAPHAPLRVDTSLYWPGTTINNAVISGSSLQNLLPVENIVWSNAVGAAASGNNLTKTGNALAWDAGASSTRAIVGDGYVEFTATETGTYRMLGLNDQDTNQYFADLDYAFILTPNSGLAIFESGVDKSAGANLTPYASGDRFRISVEAGVVKYRKNGVLVYTSTVAPNYPLVADTSFYSPGGTLNNAVLAGDLQPILQPENIVWTNGGGVSITGNSLSKTDASGWGNGGASSTKAITSGFGYVEFTASETNTYRMFGLSNGDSNKDYWDIDFAIYLAGDGWVYVYEAGNYRGYFVTYASGDKLRVSVESGVVRYRKNGVVFYSSPVAPTYPLLADTAFYNTGATVTNAVIYGQTTSNSENVVWTNVAGVSVSGSSLTKTAAWGWGNAGAVSNKAIASGDGYVEFTASENSYRMFGLSNGDSNQDYTDIDFALFPVADGNIQVYERGGLVGSYGTYVPGDRLRVSVEGGVVKYRKNGTLLLMSSQTPVYPLLADTSFYSTGATITDAVISGQLQPITENVAWVNAVGVSITGNSLAKTAAAGWGNGGAVSSKALASGDGYVEFTASETNTYRMCGLSNGDTDQNWTDIDYAIYPYADGTLYIMERGASVAPGGFGTYSVGDRLRVGVEGGVVKYRKNGVLLYTSSVAPTYPLLVDTSLYSQSATITNAVISGAWQSPPSNQPPVARPAGPYSGVTGTAVQFNGSTSSDSDGTISSYSWNFGDGQSGTTATPSHTYASAGTYTVTLTVTDNQGAQASAQTTVTISVSNQSPIARPGGPYTGTAGTSVQFNGSTSSDPDGSISSYSWNFGDGTTGTGATASHSYSSAGTYTVTLTVTDNQGAQASTMTSANISAANQPPVANAGGAYKGASGVDVQFSGAGSLDSDGTISSYQWDFGDGSSISASQPTQPHQYERAGTYTVTLRVTDNNGAQSSPATTSITVSDFSMARLNPVNRTGTGGEDLLSGNYNWMLPLISVPGRAGLDLGLALSYNSLVWTKADSLVTFDADHGFPSPGFRLGFPSIQKRFYNTETQKYAYLLITPSGSRVELRQTATAGIYEAADSSYLQLDTNNGQMVLRATDGTQLSYSLSAEEYHCTQIEDRNGNYITIAYDAFGHITTITDTLARVTTFNYDANQNLISIMQMRSGQAQPVEIVTFGYTNQVLSTNFSNSTIFGTIQNGATVPVLSQVGLNNGHRYNFTYNTWGQVSRINHYEQEAGTTNWILVSYSSYNLPADNSTAQTDCPRFTERRDWAAYLNGDADGVAATAEEAVTTYGIALAGSVGTVTLPTAVYDNRDNSTTTVSTMHKEYFGTGWQKGLTTKVETYANSALVRTSETTWTQDNVSVSYGLNPRPVETNITDTEGNHRRTTIAYTSYGLPSDVYEYAANATTVLRRVHTDYNLDAAYVNRRVIGLVSARLVYEGENVLRSKTDYQYDATGEFMQSQGAAVQHDGTGYPASLTLGRANMTMARRWDANYPEDASRAVASQVGYNSTGSPIFTRDALGHQTTINYFDYFSDNTNHNTLAYPTSVTDADGYTTLSWYDYYLGAVSRTQDPLGAANSLTYDAAGRIDRITNLNNSAFKQFHYGARYVVTYTVVQEMNTPVYAITVRDGAGRVIGSAQDAPVPGAPETRYSGQQVGYDVLGQVVWQTNPTEMGPGWVATGDDAGGWLKSYQTYDWKGRVRRSINVDGTTREASYGGCGCAGGEVVTLRDEVGRLQRTTSDVLGRAVKAEVLNTVQSVYATTINTYNVLDQLLTTRQYQGQETSGVYQESVMSYDGYGRLASKKLPQQESASVYSYTADDLIQTMTDARGAVATYSYNNRHLLIGISYSAPAGITATSTVTYSYDDAGNRTGMSDGTGSTSYSYNTLSQLTSETRTLSGAGSYTLSYTYNLAGQLSSITDPYGSVSYTHDHTGRTTAVSGTGFGTVSQFASDLRYRAFGALKSMSYGSGLTLSLGYNNRLQTSSYKLSNPQQTASAPVAQTEHQYNAEGSLLSSHDLTNELFDRAYAYDQMGRLEYAYTGQQARNFLAHTSGSTSTVPYLQKYEYNVWGDRTGGFNQYWGKNDPFSASYQNHKNPDWEYDANGWLIEDGEVRYIQDAAGSTVEISQLTNTAINSIGNDGDGQVIKKVHQEVNATTTTTYYLRSSALGGKVIAELNSAGQTQRRNVYLGQELLALEAAGVVSWKHGNPVTGGQGMLQAGYAYTHTAEYDTSGVSVGLEAPEVGGHRVEPGTPTLFVGNVGNAPICTVDGINMDCPKFDMLGQSETTALCPNNDCGPQWREGGFQLWNPSTGWRHLGEQSEERKPPKLKPSSIDPNIGGPGNRNPYGVGMGIGVRTFNSDPRGSFFLIGDLSAFLLGLMPQGPMPQPSPREILDDAIERAKRRVLTHPECAGLFQNFPVNGILESFKSSRISSSPIEFSGEGNAAVTIRNDSFAGGTTRFNRNSFFFTGTVNGRPLSFSRTSSNYGLTLNEIRELVVLHEAFHIDDRNGLYDDAINSRRGVELNFLVRSRCF